MCRAVKAVSSASFTIELTLQLADEYSPKIHSDRWINISVKWVTLLEQQRGNTTTAYITSYVCCECDTTVLVFRRKKKRCLDDASVIKAIECQTRDICRVSDLCPHVHGTHAISYVQRRLHNITVPRLCHQPFNPLMDCAHQQTRKPFAVSLCPVRSVHLVTTMSSSSIQGRAAALTL